MKRTYFCPTTNKPPSVYQSILIMVIDNWFDFGLIVTAYFKEVESRLGRRIAGSDYTQKFLATSAFKEFTDLKSKWPYRRHDTPDPCNFSLEYGLYYIRGQLCFVQLRISPHENILRELDTGFSSAKEIEAADQLLDELFLEAARAIIYLHIPGEESPKSFLQIHIQ